MKISPVNILSKFPKYICTLGRDIRLAKIVLSESNRFCDFAYCEHYMFFKDVTRAQNGARVCFQVARAPRAQIWKHV